MHMNIKFFENVNFNNRWLVMITIIQLKNKQIFIVVVAFICTPLFNIQTTRK